VFKSKSDNKYFVTSYSLYSNFEITHAWFPDKMCSHFGIGAASSLHFNTALSDG